MSTYTQLLYHIIFGTKSQRKILTDRDSRKRVYDFLGKVLSNKRCFPYLINGVENHLHIATHIHPSISVSSIIKDLKVSSSLFIKDESLFTNFNGWQVGYGAFTYRYENRKTLIDYIQNQEEHHRKKSFREEYRELLLENGIEFKEDYLF